MTTPRPSAEQFVEMKFKALGLATPEERAVCEFLESKITEIAEKPVPKHTDPDYTEKLREAAEDAGHYWFLKNLETDLYREIIEAHND